MLKAFLNLLITLVFACLLGCKTNSPVVQHQRWSLQKKVQAAEHWKRLANELVDDLEKSGSLNGKTIYVTSLGERTDFSDAFSKLVLGALTDREIQVSDSSQSSVPNLVLTNQLLLHGRRYGYLHRPEGNNETSVLSRLLLGVRNFFTGDESRRSDETRGELLVSALVYKNNKLIECRNHAAYIQIKDAALYLTPSDWNDLCESEWPRPRKPSFWTFSPTIHDSYHR